MQRLYEGIIFMKPTLTEEEAAGIADKIKGTISDVKGEFLEDKKPEKKNSPYEMEKFKDAFYYYVKFNAEPDTVAVLNEKLRLTEEVIRHMIAKFVEKREEPKQKKKKEVAKDPVKKEESAEASK